MAGGLYLLLVPVVSACALIVFMAFSTDATLEGFAFYLAATIGRLTSCVVLGRIGERVALTVCG